MRLAAQDLEERGLWLISMRWLACLCVALVVWLATSVFGLVRAPAPLLIILGGMVAYNLAFVAIYRLRKARPGRSRGAKGIILAQSAMDLLSLTLLLAYSDVTRNPFILYFVFHIAIASILLPGWTPYALAALAVLLVGSVLLAQNLGLMPRYPLGGAAIPWDDARSGQESLIFQAGLLAALGSTLGITAFLTTSVSRYVQRVHSQIRQHEKMLGIGQLVAGFAHQIANPLDGLQNGLRQVEPRLHGEPYALETVRLMQDALGRIENVARRLQEFARPQGLDLQSCDANKAVGGTLELLGKTLEARGILVKYEPGAVPQVLGDPYSIEEILFNLCTNAIDAMPDGGTLRIRTFELRQPEVEPEGWVAVEIQDSGIGIPADRLERIFEPFFTTKAQAGGTGLGLGLCRMLLSEMGGRMEVESVPSKGSTFRVLLTTSVPGSRAPGHESPGR